MSIQSRGVSIQEAYRMYRDGNLVVNRQYQRKLVWSQQEKAMLVDSVIHQYPIPLILLARSGAKLDQNEIIDGMQRLNALFSFIENEFAYEGQYFDVDEFSRAKQLAESDVFAVAPKEYLRLDKRLCANFLDYQLAITQFDADDPGHVVAVFGRINSSGRQLSNQERRQAGVVSPFANLVRTLASELRGDASRERLLLSEMPSISIDAPRQSNAYGLSAPDVFWCKQGIISAKELIASEDEEMVADIVASILLNEPLAVSSEKLDELYDPASDIFKKVDNALAIKSSQEVIGEVSRTFSVLKELVAEHDSSRNFLRNLIRPKSPNPIKAPFFALFIAFHHYIVAQQLSPGKTDALFSALRDSGSRMVYSRHYATVEDRLKNVLVMRGLLEQCFVKREPPAFTHGAALSLDFENSLRRSHTETPRYEFKQGIVTLAAQRVVDRDLLTKICQTVCAIANVGPEADGYLSIGVADKKPDAERIVELDKITYASVSERHVVGIDREAKLLGLKLDDYIGILTNELRSGKMPEPLRTQVLSAIDSITYMGHTVIRVKVPRQKGVSLYDGKCYVREMSSTKELVALNEVLSVQALFAI